LTDPSVHWLADAPPRQRRLALGTFDGVHLGHRRVIADAETVVTFSPHPRAVLGKAPPLLQDLETKIELLGRLGVAEVVLIRFDPDIAAMSPREFVDRVLVGSLGATQIAVGANFRFGHRGAGSVDDLVAERRFETIVEPLLVRDGEVVSSSRIRAMIQLGQIEPAAGLLGGPFETRCSIEPEGDVARLSWPGEIVRPGPGTYLATVRQAARGPFVAWVEVGPEKAKLVSSAVPVADPSAVVGLWRTVDGPVSKAEGPIGG